MADVRLAIEVADGDVGPGAGLPVNITDIHDLLTIATILLFEVEDDLVGAGDDPSVKPEHETGDADRNEQERDEKPVQGDARRLKCRQLELLGELSIQQDNRHEQGQRRDQPDDFGDVGRVVTKEDLPLGRAPIHEVIDVFNVMQNHEEDDERSDQQHVADEEPTNDVAVEPWQWWTESACLAAGRQFDCGPGRFRNPCRTGIYRNKSNKRSSSHSGSHLRHLNGDVFADKTYLSSSHNG